MDRASGAGLAPARHADQFTDGAGVLAYKQDVDSTLHSAGVSLSGALREDANAHASLY